MAHYPSTPPTQFLTPPRPLDPVFTAVESESCIHLSSSSSPLSPDRFVPRSSPLQRMFRSVFQPSSPSLSSLLGLSTSSRPTEDHVDTLKPATHNLPSNNRTRSPFKPQKAGRGTSSWQLKEFAEATLGSGSLRKAVKLPEGEDENEWLAVNGTQFNLENRNGAHAFSSRGFLQSNQSPLWSNHRVLLAPKLSRDEGN